MTVTQRNLGLAFEGRRPESLATDHDQVGAWSAARGVLIGLLLIAAAASAGLLFTLATFGYSVGELL